MRNLNPKSVLCMDMESVVTQSVGYVTRKLEINMHSSELIEAVRSQQTPSEIHSQGDIQDLKSLPYSLPSGFRVRYYKATQRCEPP